jgi:hypothetical protein
MSESCQEDISYFLSTLLNRTLLLCCDTNWYRKAIEAGNLRAMRYLGAMYEEGRGGLPEDGAEAASWYRKAAEAGDTDARKSLKRLTRRLTG